MDVYIRMITIQHLFKVRLFVDPSIKKLVICYSWAVPCRVEQRSIAEKLN